jgi:hypothetical protein
MMLVALQWITTTPARLKAFVGAGWVIVFVLAAIIVSSTGEHRDAVHKIAVDHAPSVGSAHRIKVEVEALDAALVNEMLVAPAEAHQWRSDFQNNRVELGIHLLNAIRSVYSEGEVPPLQRIQESLGRYLMAAQAALDAHHRGLEDEALADYRESYRILESELVPSATALHDISDHELEAEYEDQIHHSHRVRIVIIVFGIVLMALIGATQLYVTRRFRRRLSPGLVVAAVLTVVLVAYSVRAFTANDNALAGVKKDAYDSASALLEVQAYAYEANSSESRWLLDRADRADQERRFHESINKILPGGNLASVVQRVRERNKITTQRIAAGDSARAASSQARMELPLEQSSGALRDPLNNITFHDDDPVEDEPTQALETVERLLAYYKADAQIRDHEGAGNHALAIAFCLGMNPGESNWAFTRFDESLTRWVAINEEWLAHYTDEAFAAVARVPAVTIVLAFAIAAAVALALRPRIREYA